MRHRWGLCTVRLQSLLCHDEVTPSISEVRGRDQILHHRDRQQGRPSAFGLEQVGHEEHLRSTQKGFALIFKNKRHQRGTWGERVGGGGADPQREVWTQSRPSANRWPTCPSGMEIQINRLAYRAQRNRRGVTKWIHSLCSRPPGLPV